MQFTALTRTTTGDQAGAKAANLARLIGLGVPVPPAVVFPRAVLCQFLQDHGLIDSVRSYLSVDPDVSHEQFGGLCQAVTDAHASSHFLEREIARSAELLGAGAASGLAVRSSSCHEDSRSASFAGIFDSSLCLSTPGDVTRAILTCWCSSWSPQAVAYARHLGVTLEPDHMAVIVQEVAAADSSGVLFTADPHTGNPWTFVVNSTFGLAQDLVDGAAAADEFLLEWNGAVQNRHIADKATSMVPGTAGLARVDLPDTDHLMPSLTEEQLPRLARMALEIDRAFDARMDLEWVLVGEEFQFVQARPITALPPFFPHDLSDDDAARTWRRTQREPIWPLYRELRDSDGWLMYKPPGVALGHLEHDERDVHGYRYSTEPVWRDWSGSHQELESWLVQSEEGLRNEWEMALDRMLKQTQEASRSQRQCTTARDLIPILLAQRRCMFDLEPMNLGPSQSLGWLCEDLLEHIVADHVPDFDVAALLQGIATYSYERALAMQKLGRSMHEPFVRDAFLEKPLDAVLPHLEEHHADCDFLSGYESFCWRFGMRLPSWDRRPASWSEGGEYDPIQTLYAIKQSLLGHSREARSARAEADARREAYAAETRQSLAQRDPLLADRFDRALTWAQYWVPLLDERQWYCVGSIRLGELVWEVGVRLQREGFLRAPEDVLLFGPGDLDRMGGDLDLREKKSLADTRTLEWERIRRLEPPEHLGLPPQRREGQPAPAAARPTPPGQVIAGRGYSPGEVTGTAHRAADMTDPVFLDSLRREHILVCLPQAFDGLTDWLAILLTVRGLVSLDGPSRLHHAVQLARECGVPMINLKGVAAESLPDGSGLALDGAAGTVSVEPQS